MQQIYNQRCCSWYESFLFPLTIIHMYMYYVWLRHVFSQWSQDLDLFSKRPASTDVESWVETEVVVQHRKSNLDVSVWNLEVTTDSKSWSWLWNDPSSNGVSISDVPVIFTILFHIIPYATPSICRLFFQTVQYTGIEICAPLYIAHEMLHNKHLLTTCLSFVYLFHVYIACLFAIWTTNHNFAKPYWQFYLVIFYVWGKISWIKNATVFK